MLYIKKCIPYLALLTKIKGRFLNLLGGMIRRFCQNGKIGGGWGSFGVAFGSNNNQGFFEVQAIKCYKKYIFISTLHKMHIWRQVDF